MYLHWIFWGLFITFFLCYLHNRLYLFLNLNYYRLLYRIIHKCRPQIIELTLCLFQMGGEEQSSWKFWYKLFLWYLLQKVTLQWQERESFRFSGISLSCRTYPTRYGCSYIIINCQMIGNLTALSVEYATFSKVA